MRAIRTTTISFLAVGLVVVGSSGLSVAQDAEPDIAAIDGTWSGVFFDANDPRLDGEVSYGADITPYGRKAFVKHDDSGDEVLAVTPNEETWRISNDDGSWDGSGTNVKVESPADGVTFFTSTVTLRGKGAYDGLTAYLLVDWTQRPLTIQGAIYPSDAP